jgi:hypothetical protein
MTWDEFLQNARAIDPGFETCLRPGGEADEAFRKAHQNLEASLDRNHSTMPTLSCNAEPSLARLCYSLVRWLKPRRVLETGVAYGITSSVLLQALERNGRGTLDSIDIPPLLDSHGSLTGIAIPADLRNRWRIHLGASRSRLPSLVRELGKIDLFVSDSRNIFTMQRYEYGIVKNHLAEPGAMVFNNISPRFQERVKKAYPSSLTSIWQKDKPGCATGLLLNAPKS